MNVTALRIYPVVTVEGLGPVAGEAVGQYLGDRLWIHGPGSLFLPLQDVAYDDPYIVKTITGLEAPDLSDFEVERTVHNNFGVLTERVITALVVLNPANSENLSITELREFLYKFISSLGPEGVEVRLMDGDNHICSTRGRISGIETSLFEKTSQVIITIRCPNHIFESPNLVYLGDPTLEPPDYILGGSGSIFRDEASTTPSGMAMIISVLEDVDSFSIDIFHQIGNQVFTVDKPLANGSALLISSFYGSIFAYYTTDGLVYESVVNKITKDSYFPAIYPGDNAFIIEDDLNFKIINARYYPSYWGI